MAIKIASVGQQINNIEKNINFCSRESLSPYDVIVFKPFVSDTDKGAYSIDNLETFCNHWGTELNIARTSNKIIVMLLPTHTKVNGRMGSVNLADVVDNLPDKRIVEGKDIKLGVHKHLGFFQELGKIFSALEYEYVFTNLISGDNRVLVNQSNCPVCVLRHNDYPRSNGYVIFCQDLYKNVEIEQKNTVDNSFCQWLIKLYGRLKPNNDSAQNAPYWAEDEQYKTIEEQNCENEIRQCEIQMVELEITKEKFKAQKQEYGKLKSLLYAYDKPLEQAVNQALKLLGIDAREYDNKENQLQIDTEFKIENLTVLGETKGHTGFANNDDINQLIGNSLQYFDEVCSENEDIPKKILFLNSEREKDISERNRENCCSGKVLKLAKSDKVAIVWTPDLFWVAKYVADSKDTEFAKRCVETMINTDSGLVSFPKIPSRNI